MNDTGSNPVLTTNMGTLMEGGNKTHNMVRSGVTVWLMAPLAGLGSSPNVSTKSGWTQGRFESDGRHGVGSSL